MVFIAAEEASVSPYDPTEISGRVIEFPEKTKFIHPAMATSIFIFKKID
jgi:hypothetical protein